MSRPIARVRSGGLRDGTSRPFSPSRITSRMPGTLVPMTGTPAAIASISTSPKPSASLGKTSMPMFASASCGRATTPSSVKQSVLCDTIQAECARILLHTHADAPCRPAGIIASIKSSIRLTGSSRPMKPTGKCPASAGSGDRSNASGSIALGITTILLRGTPLRSYAISPADGLGTTMRSAACWTIDCNRQCHAGRGCVVWIDCKNRTSRQNNDAPAATVLA